MTTLTDKELIKEIKERISSLDVRDNIERRSYEIALASLEAEPIAVSDDMAYAFHHALSDSSPGADEVEEIKAGLRAAFANVTAQPEPVVPDEIGPNDSNTFDYVDGWNACRAAMLHGAEPVSQTYKLPPLSSNEVNDAAWKLRNMLTEHGHLNGRQFNNLKGCFYEALKVAMRNSPVTPDSWISCSERMPEMGERQCYVLAADFKNNYPPSIPNTQVGVYGDWFNDGNPTWDDGDGEDLHLKEVTHWMPLPEPPQEVK